MTHDSHDHLDLISLEQKGSKSLEHLFQTSHSHIKSSSLALPMLYASVNALLSENQACALMDFVLQDENTNVFEVLISQRTPTTKAIARILLPRAIQSADIKMVRMLLGTGISIDLALEHNVGRPLYLAAKLENLELVQLFLDHGARVNLPCTFGKNFPLVVAAEAGNQDIVRLLVDAGAAVNVTNGIYPALHLAVESGNLEVVQVLLDAGASINAQKLGDGDTALHVALKSKNIAIAQLLLSRGAATDVASHRGTALRTAVNTGVVALVDLLLSHGADVHEPAVGCTGLLEKAASKDAQEIVSLMLAWGASDIASAMDAASRNGHTDTFRIIETHVSPGILPAEARERMILSASVRSGDLSPVHTLLHSGRDIDVDCPIIGNDGQLTTPLQAAAERGRLDLVQLLIQFGADVNKPPGARGYTALQGACISGSVNLVKCLLSFGADVNAPTVDSDLPTPLVIATGLARLEIAQLLLESGVDMAKQGPDALRAVLAPSNASKQDREEVLQFLLDHWVYAPVAEVNGEHRFQAAVPFNAYELGIILFSYECTCLLLQHGLIDPSAALLPAMYIEDAKVIGLLLDSGAYFRDTCFGGQWVLERAGKFGNVEILHRLLEHDLNAQEKGFALEKAVQCCCIEAVRLLVESGADVNADPVHVDRARGRTLLQTAAGTGDLALVEYLLDQGAEVERMSTAWNEAATALQYASIAGSIAVVNELVQRGANVNASPVGKDGRTALEGAAEHGRLDMVQLLLNLEAETQGSRALHFAKREGHEGVVALLLENGFEDVSLEETWSDDDAEEDLHSWMI